MRALVLPIAFGLCVACGQKLDHPDRAPSCDPAVMHCLIAMNPATGGPGGGGDEGGASSGEEVGTFTGDVLAFNDDYFDGGLPFSGEAQVSATGESGARVTSHYDGTSFELASVLKDPVNWFYVVPE